MDKESNGDGKSRLDRREGLMELLIEDHLKFSDEHWKLLTSQVLLTDRMQELAEAQKHTDERMGVLIGMMDDLIRKREGR